MEGEGGWGEVADGLGLGLLSQFSHCLIQSLFSSRNICYNCSVNMAWMLTAQLLPFQTQVKSHPCTKLCLNHLKMIA